MNRRRIELNLLSRAEKESWLGLLAVANKIPDGWALTGGGLMRLLSEERGYSEARATQDVDVILDVRARRSNIGDFYQALDAVGYKPDGFNASGQNHRWVYGHAQIDVLVPSGLSLRTLSWNYPGFGRLLPTRGAQFLLYDLEKVTVHIDGQEGTINRPSALGALYGKCSALLNNGDRDKRRHLSDIAILCQILDVTERRRISDLSGKQRFRLQKGVEKSYGVYKDSSVGPELNRVLRILDLPQK